MHKIAFFGAGLMGTGFVKRARANGIEVNVWNRSPAKARALQPLGARAFDDPAAALAGVQRIHLSLADDASVDAVLEPLAGRIGADTWIVDHTTTAVRPTAERAARWAARGRVFQHAPVFMGPANAADGSGLMLVSGPRAQHDALLPALQRMTGTVHYVGEAPQRAAAFKLFGNLTLLGLLGLLGDVNRLAHAVGIDTKDAFSLFDQFNPGATLPARAARITAAEFDKPSFEIAMARKDVRLMIEEARRGGVELFVMPGLAAMFDAAIARGEGALDAAAAARMPL
ncbi:MAG TPA: NAD(P)-binding domain-containing protein [Rubrivivax sp.]|nr:NAD(P)-binding domain-containing protein [Rubrivivax sp.]HPO18682.1 NAD(P)-binding domain-containing protein [Rubrivivax sp.]